MVKKILLVLLISCLMGVFTLIGVELVYADQLLPGVTIDHRSFTGQNRNVILQDLQSRFTALDEQGLTLQLDDKSYQAHLTEIGIGLDYNAMLDRAFALSHTKIIGLAAAETAVAYARGQNNVEPLFTTDAATYQKFMSEVVHSHFSTRPVDASLTITDTDVTISAEQNGLWVDDAALATNIQAALHNHQSGVPVEVAKKAADIIPAELSVAKTDAEALLSRHITLTSGTKKIIPNRAEIKDWIFIKPEADGLHASVDPEKLKTYLTKVVAPKVELKSVSQITDKNGNLVSGGQDGTSLKLDDSVTVVLDALTKDDLSPTIALATETKNRANVIVDPQLGCDPDKSSGKYIELNLTMQKMCLWEGGAFINTYRVSTGKWSTPTPVGTFAIQNKINPAYSAKYDLYMPYWKAITPDGAYGIHGLPYRGNWVEGQGHIGTPVSHGCIRLGPGDDVFVHNWAEIGTPVFIHK